MKLTPSLAFCKNAAGLIKMQKKYFKIYGIVFVFSSYLLLLCALYVLNRQNKVPSNYAAQIKEAITEMVRPGFSADSSRLRSGLPAVAGRTLSEIEWDRSPQEEIFVPLESREGVRVPKNEGTLWIDRKRSQCLITLGKTDGIKKGLLVDIYDGERQVGKARVIRLFDSISYAELVGRAQEHLTKDYYKVSFP